MIFSFSCNPKIALIGDIKDSKQLKDRKTVQELLKATLERINHQYSKDISARFTITLGDEFQGLLCEGEHLLDIIDEIQKGLYPVEIRFGIGVGPITTEINSEIAIGADGPAFYHARSAIEDLKQQEQKYKTQSSKIRIVIEEDKNFTAEMINSIFSLLTVIQNNWTKRQREIIWDCEQYQDSQLKSAKRLGIAQSSVQRALINGNYYAYKEAKNTVNHVLKEIRRRDV